MGTYDTPGGTPISPDESDDGMSVLQEQIWSLLDNMQTINDDDAWWTEADKIIDLIGERESQLEAECDALRRAAQADPGRDGER